MYALSCTNLEDNKPQLLVMDKQQVLQYSTNSPFFAVNDILTRGAGISFTESTKLKTVKLGKITTTSVLNVAPQSIRLAGEVNIEISIDLDRKSTRLNSSHT